MNYSDIASNYSQAYQFTIHLDIYLSLRPKDIHVHDKIQEFTTIWLKIKLECIFISNLIITRQLQQSKLAIGEVSDQLWIV